MMNPYFNLIYPKAAASFYGFKADYFHELLSQKQPSFWQKAGEKMALKLFRLASENVPAYKDFLKKRGVGLSSIKTIKDFKNLPITNKENYLNRYPLEKLCWGGKLDNSSLFSVSSGSSGKPFFWPRGENLELETSISHEMFLKYIFGTDKKPTLFINTFSMGIYIAGVITLNSVLRVAEKHYPITIINPGINQEEILRILKDIAPQFPQVIISGYPPFVKDVLDACLREKIDLSNQEFKFLFATESISEKFRDYVLKRVRGNDALSFSLNIYGSADAGILGHETPLSIFIKRNANLSSPTFVQYNPLFKYYEQDQGELIFSAFGGIPLVRYNIHDLGKAHNYQEAVNFLPKEKRVRLPDPNWKLPFLSVFGKSDNVVSLYGVNIYPEHIKAGMSKDQFKTWITGKFVAQRRYKSNQSQYLQVNIELVDKMKKPTAALLESLKEAIVASLKKHNLEYNRLYQAIGRKADPKILLWPKNYQKYFSSKAIKHRWIR